MKIKPIESQSHLKRAGFAALSSLFLLASAGAADLTYQVPLAPDQKASLEAVSKFDLKGVLR